jgi:ribonuclease T
MEARNLMEMPEELLKPSLISQRFRGFLPVVIDVETGGFNAKTDAMLEIAAVILEMDSQGNLQIKDHYSKNIEPFSGAVVEQAALEFTGIDIYDPERNAEEEGDALRELFQPIRREVSETGCTRAVMVAHNAHFDLSFVNAAVERAQIKRNPFHPFSCFDTSSLSGLAYGQTVLAKACHAAKIDFNNQDAHSALYDTTKTAELFCSIVNRWKELGGWPTS